MAKQAAQPDELSLVDVTACCTTALVEPLSRTQAEALAKVLKAAAEPARLQLLSLIAAAGQACACDLTGLVGLSQPTVSHHLKVLTQAGLISREQRGTWAWFTVNPDRMRDLSQLFNANPPTIGEPQRLTATTSAPTRTSAAIPTHR